MTYTLYVAAFAGAGITVLALVSDLPLSCSEGGGAHVTRCLPQWRR